MWWHFMVYLPNLSLLFGVVSWVATTILLALLIHTIQQTKQSLEPLVLNFTSVWVFVGFMFVLLEGFHFLCITVQFAWFWTCSPLIVRASIYLCPVLFAFSAIYLLVASHVALLFWCLTSAASFGCGHSPASTAMWFPRFLASKLHVHSSPQQFCSQMLALNEDTPSAPLVIVCVSLSLAVASYATQTYCLYATRAPLLRQMSTTSSTMPSLIPMNNNSYTTTTTFDSPQPGSRSADPGSSAKIDDTPPPPGSRSRVSLQSIVVPPVDDPPAPTEPSRVNYRDVVDRDDFSDQGVPSGMFRSRDSDLVSNLSALSFGSKSPFEEGL